MAVADAVIAEIAGRQFGVVALHQLLERGVSRDAVALRVSDGRLVRLHRGVYAVGVGPVSRDGRWLAAVLAMGPRAVLSHTDAAARWGLHHTWGPVDVTVAGMPRRPRSGIRVHRSRLHPEDVTCEGEIPVTSVARTLLDLAVAVGETGAQRAYERMERLRMLDVRSDDRLLARSRGHRGVRVLRGLRAYDPTTAAQADSELERLFLDWIRDLRLPTPLVNVVVHGFVVDAYWPDARLVVELQGYEFHSRRETFERDHRKLARLGVAGIELLPLTHSQVTTRDAEVTALLRRLLTARSRIAPG